VRALVQRVSQASVEVEGKVTGEIGAGLLVLLGVATSDTAAEADRLAEKVVRLRCFPDEQGAMNRALLEPGGEPGNEVTGAVLAVSQFTLYGDTARGHRPSFVAAAPAAQAETLYRAFVEAVRARGVPVAEGVFRAHMRVSLINDGPVTLLLEVGAPSVVRPS
jgi:D-tyrosyl-tRNA(Tyr) deacylase